MKKKECIFFSIFIIVLFSFFNFSFSVEEINQELSGEFINEVDNDLIEDEYDFSGLYSVEGKDYIAKSLRAKVLEASEEYIQENEYYSAKAQKLKVRITDKEHRGEEYDVIYYLEDDFNTRLPLYHKIKANDPVYVYITFENGIQTGDVFVQYYDKTPWMICIFLLFAISVVIIGGKKGIRAFVGLIITVILIFKALIPSIIAGYNPILITILLSIIVTLLTFLIVSGFSKKSLCAIIGTSSGVIVAGIIGLIFSNLMQLTGINEHARMIAASVSADKEMLSFTGIMLSAVMISALGACMDVGMSISSALYELKEKKPELNSKELIKSGFNIGKDVMGTMTNTLILAYVGSAMLCILLYSINKFSLPEILNQEDIAMEVVKSIAGSIGLIYTIPLTAIVSGLILGQKSDIIKPGYDKNAYVKENIFKG